MIIESGTNQRGSPCEYALNRGLTGYSYHSSDERHRRSSRFSGVVYGEKGTLDALGPTTESQVRSAELCISSDCLIGHWRGRGTRS